MTNRDTDTDRRHKRDIETIDREELKTKLDRGDEFKLVMTIGEFEFRTKHIPGSIHVQSEAEGLELLNPDDEIVIYCAHEDCIASLRAYEILKQHGYADVRRYSGGIADWEEGGYPTTGRRGMASDRQVEADESDDPAPGKVARPDST